MKVKRDLLYIIVIAILLATCAQLYYTKVFEPQNRIHVYYNHDAKLDGKIVETIQDADKFVYFAIYTFTKKIS